jgi:hypothetical protein
VVVVVVVGTARDTVVVVVVFVVVEAFAAVMCRYPVQNSSAAPPRSGIAAMMDAALQ